MHTPLYWIDGPWTGRLAVASRPRGGDWLEEEIRAWQHAGLDIVVSLLTAEEVTELALSDEETWCQVHGVQFCAFPITDRGVPTSRSASVELVRKLDAALTEGKSMVIHCRQGIGRSAVLAACLLTASGEEPEIAFRHVSVARGCAVPDTAEQREWVNALAAKLLVPLSRSKQ